MRSGLNRGTQKRGNTWRESQRGRQQGGRVHDRRLQKKIAYGIIFSVALVMMVVLMGYLREGEAAREQEPVIKAVTYSDPQDGALSNQSLAQEFEEYSEERKKKYISEHPSEYPAKLLELLEKNPELLDYVFYYPMRSSLKAEIDLTEEMESDSVPRLYQWDLRWGYEPYAGGMVGYTGCGPTCLSMVALHLTKNAEYTPAYVAAVAEKEGYSVKGTGTSWELMSRGCKLFGLHATELPLDDNRMMSELANGHPIICAMGKGDFTENGHFIVISGYLGGFLVNDPNSSVRSEKVWSFDELRPQIRNLWAYR